MGAFERIRSGLPSLDRAVDSIRLGDNVVWRVSNLDDFRMFAEPFVDQAIADGRNIVYVRFAAHPPLLRERRGLTTVCVLLSNRFETFTVAIHELIEKEGRDAFYVFDCLSELQTAWATDLMMGDFFRLTCPFLFRLDTVAWFPVIRGKHSFDAIAKIRDTTQLFLDVYSSPDRSRFYLRPMKVWNRYSSVMFLPHAFEPATGELEPVRGGVEISAFYQLMSSSIEENADLNADSWDRFFQQTETCRRNGLDVSAACERMCSIMLTRDEKLRKLICGNFMPEDYFAIRSRMIGTGLIGGKACGMLLARRLVQNLRPDIYDRLEPHDSYYVGSDVYYSYIVDNDLWDMKLRQRTGEEYFTLAGEFAERLKAGTFSRDIEEQFERMLDYYGQDPIIVRSSSILEDGFGSAFAGKYESVFCANSGSPAERLSEFEAAVRTVYASAVSLSALDYRMRRGLQKQDEQMALLVQRVSGARYGQYFMPCAAGVGYSVSPYRIGSADGGMLRLVMGLGTAAVDRKSGSYPRLVSLEAPEEGRSCASSEKHRYSQQMIDVVNTENGGVDSITPARLSGLLPEWMEKQLFSHDREAEDLYRERGQSMEIRYISCEGLVRNSGLMQDMKDILALLMQSYAYPVDIEFTVNVAERGGYLTDLLQCRPLQTAKEGGIVKIPAKLPQKDVFLETAHTSMGFSRKKKLDIVVLVDARGYYEMPYRDKYEVRDALNAVNWHFRGMGKCLMLLSPGRIATSSPELGVPTAFSDISEFSVIAEVEEDRAGYRPELSYGSHIFQDLVEAGVLYTAVFLKDTTKAFRPELLAERPNMLTEYYPQGVALNEIVKVYDLSDTDAEVMYDMLSERLVCICPPRSKH
ncbi:MAG: PEP/pyruvate-binding domain-containing protein [Lachnospiraceae bacterium]|jgi:pyruvate,water dikinase|nr:PEP/pyruvate-binding domain-containing protein [Lachnospiraceae bacterium]